jgi:pilus assembly protein CpaE
MNPDAQAPAETGLSLLLIEPDQKSAAFMRHMLMRAGYTVSYAPNGKEGLIAAWRDQPDAILVELDLPDLDGLEVIRRLRADVRTQRKWILCLTKRSAPDAAQQALELGVEDYIVKQADAVDLVLRRLAQFQQAFEPHADGTSPLMPGRIIAFLGAKGGVGTSSLCLNLAHEIAGLDLAHPTAVADLVLPMGDLAHFTGVETPSDIVELTSNHQARALTPDTLRYELPRPEGWNIQVLPGSPDPARGSELVPDRLAPIIQTLRSTFHQIFVDVGRTLSPLAMLVLRQADVLVMVHSPSLGSVANTAAALKYLQQEGIPDDRFYLLSNRPLGVEDLTADEVAAVVGRGPNAAVPHLGDNLYISNRLHLPLEVRFARTTTTMSVKETAGNLAAHLQRAERARP